MTSNKNQNVPNVNNSSICHTPSGATTVDLLQYIKEQGFKWASLSFKKGKFYLRVKEKKNCYYCVAGASTQEIMSNLQNGFFQFCAIKK